MIRSRLERRTQGSLPKPDAALDIPLKLTKPSTRRGSSLGINSKSRSVSRSVDKPRPGIKPQICNIIKPEKIDTCDSTLFDTFQAECFKLPGSENFLKSELKSAFEPSKVVGNLNQQRRSRLTVRPRYSKKRTTGLAKHQHYEPNLDTVRHRRDLLCTDFGLQQGRPLQGSIFQRFSAFVPQAEGITYSKSPSVNPSGSGSILGRNFDTDLPRETDSKSKLPSWMQKGTASRLYLKSVTEKGLETNCYINKHQNRSKNMPLFDTSVDRVASLRRRSKEESSNWSEDLEAAIKKHRQSSPINIIV